MLVAPTAQQLKLDAAKNGCNIALHHLADAAERKNYMAHKQHMSKFYASNPNSPEAELFHRFKPC